MLLVHRLKRHRPDPARAGNRLDLGGARGSGEGDYCWRPPGYRCGPQRPRQSFSRLRHGPRPLDKGKGVASSSSAQGSAGVSKEERRRRLRRADGSASSPSASKVVPPPPPAAAAETAPLGSQAPAGGPAAAAPTPSGATTVEGVPTAPTAATASTTAMSSSTPSAAAEEALAAPAPTIEVDAVGASSSIPLPTPEETEVIFGWQLRSSVEPEAAPVPLPWVLSRAHQALQKIEAAILREWDALEAEHQRLSDWCVRPGVGGGLEGEEAGQEQEHLDQREEVITELQAKLSAFNKILEEQRVQQTTAVESLQRLQRELDDKASSIALAEENLKEKDASLDKRLEAEEKEQALEEPVRQFEAVQAAQATPGPQAVEAMQKTLEDLQAEHRTRVQRIAAWADEASTTLVLLGMSPIQVLQLPTSISAALPVLDSAADCLRCLDQPVIAGLVADTEDAAREGVQDTVEVVAKRF
eukprot:XP_020400965.1 uncharacterized protein LOC109942828 [Zea mays]